MIKDIAKNDKLFAKNDNIAKRHCKNDKFCVLLLKNKKN